MNSEQEFFNRQEQRIVARVYIEKKSFNVVCAWCLKKTGTSEVENSHSICADCTDKLLKR